MLYTRIYAESALSLPSARVNCSNACAHKLSSLEDKRKHFKVFSATNFWNKFPTQNPPSTASSDPFSTRLLLHSAPNNSDLTV